MITLSRNEPVYTGDNSCRRNWTMEVTATPTADSPLDGKIFVYHAAELDDPIRGDEFSNVASLQDMNNVPPDAPIVVPDADGTAGAIPFYRVSVATFDCHNLTELERIWRIICVDTKNLVEEYKSARNLQPAETVTYE